jgi:beta-galactosidase
MGLNTIATYVFWNYHEPERGKFDFSSESRNIAEFVRLAQEESLWVILRPGPYACAEWEFGGYPWWLLREKDLIVRGMDQRFLDASAAYLNRLGSETAPLQITRGGPIILVQVENEYGSFGSDKEFMAATRDQIRAAGFEVPLFTADGPSQCRNAFLPDVLPAINGEDKPGALRDTVNKYHNGRGPYFSPEFYPGWLDHWGEKHAEVPVDNFIGNFDSLLSAGISVNLYMFHGGTNFGFTNGANYGGHYQPQPTSYDYDAPLDEAGRPTPKYYKIRETIARHLPLGSRIPDVSVTDPMIEIPPFELNESAPLFDARRRRVKSDSILSMEDVGQGSGYILYRSMIASVGECALTFDELRDYGIVLVNGKRIASLDRRHRQKKLTLNITSAPAKLEILVENGGRINYGRQMTDNRKGITRRVLLNGEELTGWEMIPIPLDSLPKLQFGRNDPGFLPAFHRATFQLTRTGDTFFDMSGWGKGCVWVNGHNLGRFWYIGPQQTLYCPGCWLNQGTNEIVVLELEDKGSHVIKGLTEPVLNVLHYDLLAPPIPDRSSGKVRLDSGDLVVSGSFMPGDTEQVVRFGPRAARYVCLQSISSLRSDPFASISELYAVDEKGTKLDRTSWKVFSVESEELTSEDGRAENAFDDDVESIWHTQWGTAKPNHPHNIAIDMGREQTITGFIYRSRQENAPGKIKEFKFYSRKQPFEVERKQ